MTGVFEDPTFWVAVGTVLFILVLIWQKVPGMVAKMLDKRAAAIKAELDEAKRLREEAEVLLKQYRAKTAGAQQEAQAIIEAAKASAERMAADARTQLQQQIERPGRWPNKRSRKRKPKPSPKCVPPRPLPPGAPPPRSSAST